MSFTNQVDLSVLLQNTAKPAMDYVDRSSTKSIDISMLDACFGGFTPMALGDGFASSEQYEAAEKRRRERAELVMKARAVEAMRASDEREWEDVDGTVWRYVVLDGADVRIAGCESPAAQLVIPGSIEGKPVIALGDDACAFLDNVESVDMQDSVITVGYSAFRECRVLKRVRFSRNLASYDSNWFRGSLNLEDVVLPGGLEKLEASIFDSPRLKRLTIGAGTCEVAPGAFQKSKLESVAVDAGNPLFKTDGKALYSFDESVLVTLMVPVEAYRVLDGCHAIAKKAFCNFSCLERVDFPEDLEALGEFALSNTAIASFKAPKSLISIGEKAFFNCAKLENVELNEGLREVRGNAFTATSIEQLHLPSTVEVLGNPLAARTSLTYAGEDATFSIEKGSEHLILDHSGCLYRKTPDGLVLDRMMNPEACSYDVLEGTISIGDDAFGGHANLERVGLPEGLERVGKRAFKGCRSLRSVEIPPSLLSIDDEAFLDTALESIALPAALQRIGENALVTYGAHHGENPTLRRCEVATGNEQYCTDGNLLLERKPNGCSRVVLCVSGGEDVRIPADVDELAPYALNGISGLRELQVSDRITSVGMRGLAVDGLVECIRIDLVEPIEGHASFELHFPTTDRSGQQQMLALSVPDHVNPRLLFEHYDAAIINASSFDAQSTQRMALYDQATRLVERLKDPVFLTQVNRNMCDRALKTNIADICVEAAKRDDRRLIDDLLDMGYVDDGNINEVIDRVGAVQDASMTGYLLEAKRERFGAEALDFDL